MRKLVYLTEVVTLELYEDKCNGCKMCLSVCPHNVFEFSGKKAHIVHKDSCMECGACQLNCPVNAIKVNSGVGCAAGIINGFLNNTDPSCGCTDSGSGCC